MAVNLFSQRYYFISLTSGEKKLRKPFLLNSSSGRSQDTEEKVVNYYYYYYCLITILSRRAVSVTLANTFTVDNCLSITYSCLRLNQWGHGIIIHLTWKEAEEEDVFAGRWYTKYSERVVLSTKNKNNHNDIDTLTDPVPRQQNLIICHKFMKLLFF